MMRPIRIIDADTEAERDLPAPTVLHMQLDTGVTTLFADCDLCGESLGVKGHDDCDCPTCGYEMCSAFGCGRCALLQDVDR